MAVTVDKLHLLAYFVPGSQIPSPARWFLLLRSSLLVAALIDPRLTSFLLFFEDSELVLATET